ncbi:unnamed protein product [Paramecium primaurelia]|uniref:Uncharacterized protein n=2 Tax=Paramecium TaxID=5884 RepID=A0A8S1XG32_9CILI|nr:unnamed protein product [Paramecium primaurelia]CAD8199769.1 unnamed protein product [Paramecium pentaurelia]CAD8199771.1 unnamed protein product [Paramecium pentaurelia]
MSQKIQKSQLQILSKSKQIKVKEDCDEVNIFNSYISMHTEERDNHHKEFKDKEYQQRKESERNCQSVKKIEMSTHQQRKRQSQSAHQTSAVKVQFQTPLQKKTHRKFYKTPFPKQ